MRSIRAFHIRLRELFAKARRERDFVEELESHIQLHIDDAVQRGLSPADARRSMLFSG